MEMTFRWFGKDFDTVTLEQIRQIPGVTGIITTLYDTMPGYGLYDRALGACYINGLWEAIEKNATRG